MVAKEKSGNPLDQIARAASAEGEKGAPPVHLWHPPYCGDLDIRIAGDGLWYYLGTPIGREALVRLFASVLRFDDDGRYYLVTPVEKIGITVEDAPFMAVQMRVCGEGDGQVIRFITNVGDEVTVDDEHPLRFEQVGDQGHVVPYVHIRRGLEAKINRPVFYDLMEHGTTEEADGKAYFGVWSAGFFFPIVEAGLLEGLMA